MAPQELECGVCSEKKVEANPHLAVGEPESFVCIDCVGDTIIPMFEAAVKHEYNYPPRWGELLEIDIAIFEDVLDPEFVQEYRDRQFEYLSKGNDSGNGSVTMERCNEYAGLKSCGGITPCRKCSSLVCASCATVVADEQRHECAGDVSSEEANEAEAQAFDGLERGVDYQICPYCDRRIQLSEACNEITCACGEHFCFICGRAIFGDELTTHWKFVCPRWGPLATATANSYDPEPEDDDAEDDDDDAAEDDDMVEGEDDEDDDEDPDHELDEEHEVFLLDYDFTLMHLALNHLRAIQHESHQSNIWRNRTITMLESLAHIINLRRQNLVIHMNHVPAYLASLEQHYNGIWQLLHTVPGVYWHNHLTQAQIQGFNTELDHTAAHIADMRHRQHIHMMQVTFELAQNVLAGGNHH